MTKVKLCFGVVILSLLGLLAGACAGQPGPAPDLMVRDAAGARDTAITYLQKQVGENAPAIDIEWDEENITPPGLVGKGTIAFTSDEWTITVSYPVVLPENAVYEVEVSSIKFGWHWKGIVKPDGSVTELSAFKQMSEEESQRIAEEFVKNSPTFVFDGIEDTLRLIDTITLRCPYCWQFIFEFDSRHAGYGDRTGQALAQVITHHIAQITIVMGEVKSAVMDDMWDMLNQEKID
jgi:hypothetical protein